MKIGLIDVDNYQKLDNCFPNLALMKLSAWHKNRGDSVEWYQPMFSGHMDKVYMSKVFSFTEDYPYFIDADEISRGGYRLTENEMDYMVRQSLGKYSDRWAYLNKPSQNPKSGTVVANFSKGVPYNIIAIRIPMSHSTSIPVDTE